MPGLRNEHGYQMAHWELKQRLGLDPNKPLPADFQTPWTNIDGEMVRVLPANKGADGKSRFGHRVVVMCSCERIIPAGRLHQHRGKASIGRGRRASPMACQPLPNAGDWAASGHE